MAVRYAGDLLAIDARRSQRVKNPMRADLVFLVELAELRVTVVDVGREHVLGQLAALRLVHPAETKHSREPA